MSLVEEVGAAVRAAAEDLPVAPVTAAVQRLRAGLDLLRWARQTSTHELGTVQLASATERLEQATRALLVAQDELSAYLAAIGLAFDAAPVDSLPPGPSPAGTRASTSDGASSGSAAPLANWWVERVAVL